MIEDYDQEDDFVSKSQLKREMEAVQAIGERLITLKPEQLQQLDLPDTLRDAVELAKRITSHGALRRQKQYIGKLMRNIEIEPIEAKFAEWERGNRAQTAKLHQLERWRERLLADDKALGELIEAYPQADVQHLRTLMRNAKKEQTANKPPKSSRELFKVLRDLMLD